MAKICPSNTTSITERETYTVWMKSLVLHGNGYTVFDSKGDVVYRVDNYQKTRSSTEVLLMDSSGKVLFSIRRKKFRFLWSREGFRWNDTEKVNNGRPWFQVRRNCTCLRKHKSWRVDLECNESSGNAGYTIVGSGRKSTVNITDFSGQLLAEAERKKSSEGVRLGEDVMTLLVEPKADRSLIMALVAVYGLVNNRL